MEAGLKTPRGGRGGRREAGEAATGYGRPKAPTRPSLFLSENRSSSENCTGFVEEGQVNG